MSGLEVRVRRRAGSFRLDADFTVGPGLTSLFGRSGAGKSTVIDLIAGLARPDEGRIAVGGTVLVDTAAGIFVPPHRRRVGTVFQDARLFPHLSVRSNLLYGRWFTPRAERREPLERIAALLGLEGLLRRRPASLSGGERQRVAIGRALLASPRILLLDEPLASLDETRKDEILPTIERLRDELGLPIVHVSHSVAEVARLADTVVVLADGRCAAVGPVAEVFSRIDLFPAIGRHEAGAVVAGRVLAEEAEWGLTVLAVHGGELRVGALGLAPGSAVRVHIRARDVILAVERPRGLSALNVLACRIVELKEEGGAVEVRLDLGGEGLIARVTRKTVADLALAPGQAVFAVMKTVAVERRSIVAAPHA